MRPSTLLAKLEVAILERHQLDLEISRLKSQLLDGKTLRRSQRKPARNRQGVSEVVEQTVAALKRAGKPLVRRELAALLKVDGSAVGYRLAQAVKLGFVEKIHHGRYAVTDAAKAALE